MSVYQSRGGLAERGAVTSQGGGPRQTEKCATHGEVKVKLLSISVNTFGSSLSFKKYSFSIMGYQLYKFPELESKKGGC